MIQEFSVVNFLSFDKKQEISFEATPDKHNINELTIQVKEGVNLLKMALIYGSNASGKSNLLLAIDALWRMLFQKHTNKQDEIISYRPFELNNNKLSVFEIVFWANGVKYSYSLKFDKTNILFEKLQYAPNGVLSLLYKREEKTVTYGSTIKITKRDRDIISSDLHKTQTVLSLLDTKNIDNEQLKIIYDWIKQNIKELNVYRNVKRVAKESEKDPDLKEFILQILRKADFNISDYKLIPSSPTNLTEEEISNIAKEREIPLEVMKNVIKDIHKSKDEDLIIEHNIGETKFELPIGYESMGTIRYFLLSRLLYDFVEKESVSMIDEVEGQLHHDLLEHYLMTFLMNTNKSQLILTTHSEWLLDQDFIRRDMVWFATKPRDTGSTELSCASDYGIHKNLSLSNAYRIDKFGVKPVLGSVFIKKHNELCEQ